MNTPPYPPEGGAVCTRAVADVHQRDPRRVSGRHPTCISPLRFCGGGGRWFDQENPLMLIRPAAPVEAFANKVGDNYVAYLINNRQLGRSWVYPTNPLTTLQQQIRAYFAAAAAAWKLVTDSEAEGWANLADQMGGTDSLGRAYGFYVNNAYLSVNLYRQLDGQAITDTAPAYAAEPGATEITDVLWNDTDSLQITFTHAAPAGSFFLVQATPFLLSARRKARRNELRIPTTSLPDSIVARSASPQTIDVNPARLGLSPGANYLGVRLLTISSGYVPGGELFVPSILTSSV